MSDDEIKTKKTILLIDDEVALLKSLSRVLSKNYIVLTAESAVKGYEILCVNKIDCVLLDIRIPGKDGIELLKEIHLSYPQVSVIMMTGHGDEDVAIQALRFGATGYMTKPLDVYHVIDEIERATDVGKELLKSRKMSEILIVDDNEDFLKDIAVLLSKIPYHVQTANSSEVALDLIKRKDIDIMLTELILPKMNGLTLIERAKHLQSDFIAIIMTGQGSVQDAIEAIKHGVFDYIRKPFEIQELNASIQRGLHALAATKELRQKNTELNAKQKMLETLNNEIKKQKNYIENIVSSMTNMLIVIDVNGLIKTFNDLTLQTLKYDASELSGQSIQIILRDENLPDLLENLKNKSIVNIEKQYYAQSGKKICCLFSASIMRDRNRIFEGYVFVAQDISNRKENEAELSKLSYYDSLTGLVNRQQFENLLSNELSIAARFHSFLGILYIDLDEFKNINEHFGHPIGDVLLKEVAKRIVDLFHVEDYVCHIGGDEFAIILVDLSDALDAGFIAQRIINVINAPYSIHGLDLDIGASIGISIYPDGGKDVTELCKNAEIALYRAKKSGRNQYQYYTSLLDEQHRIRFAIENVLRFALAKNEFHLVYQPIVNLQTGKTVSVEVLLRWENDILGNIPPGIFIPMAEKNKLLLPIGEWVIKQALNQYGQWRKNDNVDFCLSLNISILQLEKTPYLIDFLQSECQANSLSPKMIELEFVESTLMKNPSSTEEILGILHELGFNIAIDDFGKKYSSISNLGRLPIDILKIDVEFIQGLQNDVNAKIVNAIIALAQSLNMSVVAEGIETREQYSYLQTKGCDKGQGYFFYRPQPPNQLLDCLAIPLKDL